MNTVPVQCGTNKVHTIQDIVRTYLHTKNNTECPTYLPPIGHSLNSSLLPACHVTTHGRSVSLPTSFTEPTASITTHIRLSPSPAAYPATGPSVYPALPLCFSQTTQPGPDCSAYSALFTKKASPSLETAHTVCTQRAEHGISHLPSHISPSPIRLPSPRHSPSPARSFPAHSQTDTHARTLVPLSRLCVQASKQKSTSHRNIASHCTHPCHSTSLNPPPPGQALASSRSQTRPALGTPQIRVL